MDKQRHADPQYAGPSYQQLLDVFWVNIRTFLKLCYLRFHAGSWYFGVDYFFFLFRKIIGRFVI